MLLRICKAKPRAQCRAVEPIGDGESPTRGPLTHHRSTWHHARNKSTPGVDCGYGRRCAPRCDSGRSRVFSTIVVSLAVADGDPLVAVGRGVPEAAARLRARRLRSMSIIMGAAEITTIRTMIGTR